MRWRARRPRRGNGTLGKPQAILPGGMGAARLGNLALTAPSATRLSAAAHGGRPSERNPGTAHHQLAPATPARPAGQVRAPARALAPATQGSPIPATVHCPSRPEPVKGAWRRPSATLD